MGELGSWLVRAREAKGLTLEDAERDTRISRRYLQALETEQFDIIPAPVYARGFLRSYSQYLGLDPQEMLSLFPREDDFPGARRNEGRASPDRPLPSQSQSRPTWRREPERAEPRRPMSPPPRPRPQGQSPFGGRPEPAPQYRQPYVDEDDDHDPRYDEPRHPQRRYEDDAYDEPRQPQRRYEDDPYVEPRQPQRRYEDERYDEPRREQRHEREQHREPMIGVDIGVPAPARRIRTDPAAQTRSAVVAIVAIGAILGVILLAFMISNLGGDDTPNAPGGENGDGTAVGADTTATPAGTNGATGTVEGGVPRGIVPDVVGLDIAVARAQVEAAGYVVNEVPGPSAAPEGEVFGQVPVGNTHHPEGDTVTLAVSEGS